MLNRYRSEPAIGLQLVRGRYHVQVYAADVPAVGLTFAPKKPAGQPEQHAAQLRPQRIGANGRSWGDF